MTEPSDEETSEAEVGEVSADDSPRPFDAKTAWGWANDVSERDGDVTEATGYVTHGTDHIADVRSVSNNINDGVTSRTGDVTDGTGYISDGTSKDFDVTSDSVDIANDVTERDGDVTHGTCDVTDVGSDSSDGSEALGKLTYFNETKEIGFDVTDSTCPKTINVVASRAPDVTNAERRPEAGWPTVNTSHDQHASTCGEFQQHGSGTAHAQFAALTMNLSFAGCGFLGIYHLGVVHSLAQHGAKLLMNVQKYGGASAGSLIATTLAVRGVDTDVIQQCIDFCYDLAETVRNKKLGVLTPRVSLLEPLRHFLEKLLPEDAHVIAKNRLYVSLTEANTHKNVLLSEFESKEHLIQCLLGSSYVPFLTGTHPIKIGSQTYMDGGMTDNIPDIPGGRTILISPFSGRQHICPCDKSGSGCFVHINGEDFQVTANNLKRGLHAFFPPKREHLEIYFERGKTDCIRFLKKENFYEESVGDVFIGSHGNCSGEKTLNFSDDAIPGSHGDRANDDSSTKE